MPHEQLPAFLTGPLRPATVEPAGLWSYIPLPPVGGETSFLAGLPRKVRQTWANDRRTHAKLGLVVTPQPITPGLVGEGAALVVAVSAANGVEDDPYLAEYRIDSWLRRASGRTVAFVCRDATGRLDGVCFGREEDRSMDLYEVGLRAGHPHRARLYTAVVFDAPLRYSLDRGLRSIELGCGHPHPKRHRGAVQTPLYNIYYAMPRKEQ